MNKFILAIIIASISRISFAQSTNPSPYCNAAFDDMMGFPVDDHINSVSFGTLSNTTNSQYAAPHYVFYNNLSVANFIRGNNYLLSVNFTTAGGCGYGVWIDFNHNNIFETTEKISGTTGTTMLNVGTAPTVTASVMIPSTAVIGNTRMRVRIVEDDNYNIITTNELPCNASTSSSDVMDWGETEDYTINITGTTGINEFENIANLVLFPNPSTGVFTLNTDNDISKTVEVYSVFGNLIYKQALKNSQTKLDLSDQPKGIYFIRISNADKIISTKRIVIE